MIRFEAELQLDGKAATGITVPTEILDALGGGKRPRVRVTINGHTFRSTIGTMRGGAKIPVSAAIRASAGVSAGDRLRVELQTDETPRTAVIPDDLAAALAGNPGSRAFFESLSYSRQHAYVAWIEQAKKPETRRDRINRTAALLAQRHPQR
jgi:hypothetical protein